ncbi:hypothetical protein L218DRAFT_954196 [Marasmius fiardii PR-910]|nr:hypothetical protein L218DRAFT_954196 [Marasmius fiardii PR-910]
MLRQGRGLAPPETYWLSSPVDQFLLTSIQSLAILFTIVCLARRIRIHRFSWDDGWAAACLVQISGYMALDCVRWIRSQGGTMDETSTTVDVRDGLFNSTIWSSRISIALSIFRILPRGRLRITAGYFVDRVFFGWIYSSDNQTEYMSGTVVRDQHYMPKRSNGARYLNSCRRHIVPRTRRSSPLCPTELFQ